MKSNTFKTAVIVFGMTLFISNNSFGQSENREERKKPPTIEELFKKMSSKKELEKALKPKKKGKGDRK